jgi:hypothetical protein
LKYIKVLFTILLLELAEMEFWSDFIWFWPTVQCFYLAWNLQNAQKSINLSSMFFWPCIIVYQYRETNAMHLLFNLLIIKSPELEWNSSRGAANWHNTHAIFQVPFVEHLLRMSK